MKLAIPLFVLVMLGVLNAVPVHGTPPASGRGHYTGAGVVVTSVGGEGLAATFLDNGAVACQDTDSDNEPDHGVGGVCIPFATLAGDSILVADADPGIGLGVVFQACVDNNGDGACTGPGGAPQGCADRILFSHRTFDGANFNPLFVDPPQAEAQFDACQSNGFRGFVVIICAGVHGHTVPASAHTHHATEGVAKGVMTGGTPSGDFCGAPLATKPYVVL